MKPVVVRDSAAVGDLATWFAELVAVYGDAIADATTDGNGHGTLTFADGVELTIRAGAPGERHELLVRRPNNGEPERWRTRHLEYEVLRASGLALPRLAVEQWWQLLSGRAHKELERRMWLTLGAGEQVLLVDEDGARCGWIAVDAAGLPTVKNAR